MERVEVLILGAWGRLGTLWKLLEECSIRY